LHVAPLERAYNSRYQEAIMTAVATNFVVKPVDLRTVDGDEARALNAFFNLMRHEVEPDDPAIPLEESLANWRNIPPHVQVESWVFMDGGRIAAYGDVGFDLEGENMHLCGCDVSVHPEFRRRGIGRASFQRSLEVARREGRRVLLTGTNERVEAGEVFAQKFGGLRGLENHTNQLLLEELDEGLMHRWLEEAPTEQFELGFWDDGYPEDELEAVAALFEVMNTAPRGDLDINDEKVTPEKITLWEKQRRASGTQTLTAWVRDRASGQYAGFSTLGWNPNRPLQLGQWGTAVRPEFRGHGLGKWVKAANLKAMRERHPEVVKVRTGNADSNGPMLKINHAMGFKPHISRVEWQFDVDSTLERLRV
jgi:mycothiol synthase